MRTAGAIEAPSYTRREDSGPGRFAVLVGRDVAGHVSLCSEHPGTWRVDGLTRFMGRTYHREEAAARLAAWQNARDDAGL
ncbi:hypothetical protein ACQKJ1_12940 [Methylorubrum rhodesianum]|uniref:hypothetical protein n=1 Tax=Methylorubrum rhodesianum TaxID=29427 RepID=UPI003D0413FD